MPPKGQTAAPGGLLASYRRAVTYTAVLARPGHAEVWRCQHIHISAVAAIECAKLERGRRLSGAEAGR